GVQTCALPISTQPAPAVHMRRFFGTILRKQANDFVDIAILRHEHRAGIEQARQIMTADTLLSLAPIHPLFGAKAMDVDLKTALSPALARSLRQAVNRFGVVVL